MSSHVSWPHPLLLAAFSDFFQDPATFMLILMKCLLMLIGIAQFLSVMIIAVKSC